MRFIPLTIVAILTHIPLDAAQNPDLKTVTIDGSFSVTSMGKTFVGDVMVYDPTIQDTRPGYEFSVSSHYGVLINCHSTPAGGILSYTRSVNVNTNITHSVLTTLQDGGHDNEGGILWVNLQIFAYQLNRFPVTSTPKITLQPPLPGWQNVNNVDTSRTGSITL